MTLEDPKPVALRRVQINKNVVDVNAAASGNGGLRSQRYGNVWNFFETSAYGKFSTSSFITPIRLCSISNVTWCLFRFYLFS